jgi:hypothetical protein
MYKVGNIIAFTDFEDNFLCEITDVQKLDWAEDVNMYLTVEMIYKNLNKVSLKHTILLPRDDHQLLTKEEYFEEMQHEIDKKQNILNELKEKYNDN